MAQIEEPAHPPIDLVQRLLSPYNRFPGYTGETLGDMCKLAAAEIQELRAGAAPPPATETETALLLVAEIKRMNKQNQKLGDEVLRLTFLARNERDRADRYQLANQTPEPT